MTVYFVVTIGRQLEGDIVSVSFEKCFSDKEKAEAYYRQVRLEPTKIVQTENGPVTFACERRIHILDVED